MRKIRGIPRKEVLGSPLANGLIQFSSRLSRTAPASGSESLPANPIANREYVWDSARKVSRGAGSVVEWTSTHEFRHPPPPLTVPNREPNDGVNRQPVDDLTGLSCGPNSPAKLSARNRPRKGMKAAREIKFLLKALCRYTLPSRRTAYVEQQ